MVLGSRWTASADDSTPLVRDGVLVRFGDRSRPLCFQSSAASEEGESDEDVVKRAIRSTFRDVLLDDDDFFLQVKDEEWAGEFVDVLPSVSIADKSVLGLKLLRKERVSY